MLFHPTVHADNPPETWVVVKVADRCWHLRTKDDVTLQYACKTKREAEALKTSGFYVNLYEKERRWYAGETVDAWKPFRTSRNYPGSPLAQRDADAAMASA